MFKWITTSVLFFILLAHLVGYYPIFKIEQWRIRTAVKEKIKNAIPETELHCIVVAKTSSSIEMDWFEENEFYYEGSMYDIVRSVTCEDSIYYYCIQDDEEGKLFSHLDELIKQQFDQGAEKPIQTTAKKFFKTLSFLLFYTNANIEIGSTNSLASQFGFYVKYLTNPFFKVTNPPPQV